MDKGWIEVYAWVVGAPLCIAWVTLTMAAAPPKSPLSRGNAVAERGGVSGAAANPSAYSRLDLRAPADWQPASAAADRPRPLAVAERFPLAQSREAGPDGWRTRLEQDFPSLRSDGPMVRPQSRAQELTHRFRREGLPVARLFESRSALLSLGLNQHGKPGIWLIQKLP